MDTITAIASAFILSQGNNISAYDWAWSDLEDLRQVNPINAYLCIVKIASCSSPSVISIVGVGHLKPLIETSTEEVIALILEDAKNLDFMRYALACAMAFGLRTGDLKLDQTLNEFSVRWNLRALYEAGCYSPWDNEGETETSTDLKLGGFILRLRRNLKSKVETVLFQATNHDPADQIQIEGEVPFADLASWRDELKNILRQVGGSCAHRLGKSSCLDVFVTVHKTGVMTFRANFWIEQFLMPQVVRLNLDQTYLRGVVERLDHLMK